MGRRRPDPHAGSPGKDGRLVVLVARRHRLVSSLASPRPRLQRLGKPGERQIHRRLPPRARVSRRQGRPALQASDRFPRPVGNFRPEALSGVGRLRRLRATRAARSANPYRAHDAFRARHRLRLRNALALLARHDRASGSRNQIARGASARDARGKSQRGVCAPLASALRRGDGLSRRDSALALSARNPRRRLLTQKRDRRAIHNSTWEEHMNQGLKSNLKAGVLLALASIAFGLSAARADEIVIGASLPLSGPLAGFGSFQQWGYKRAVDEVNKGGGISIDGTKQMVKLIIRDDKTDPNASASNIETLISRDH